MFFSVGFGIVSAAVGAGFASGREIMHFFSRYGALSWGLCAMAAGLMGGLTGWIMRVGFEMEKAPWFGKALLLSLFAATGGAMTAAAGELAALAVPLRHARTLGGLITLGASVLASRKPVCILGTNGKILVPLMLAAFFFCARLTAEQDGTLSAPNPGTALLELLGYCGLNVTLSLGVICEAGQRCGRREQRRTALFTAFLFFILFLGGNAALLPHAGTLGRTALPVVMLLRNYGKPGFYLSAAVLYLAVFSTLTAIVKAVQSLLPRRISWRGAAAGGSCGLASLLGFGEIVGSVYPLLGWLGLLLLFGRKFLNAGTNSRFASSIERTPNKEDINR